MIIVDAGKLTEPTGTLLVPIALLTSLGRCLNSIKRYLTVLVLLHLERLSILKTARDGNSGIICSDISGEKERASRIGIGNIVWSCTGIETTYSTLSYQKVTVQSRNLACRKDAMGHSLYTLPKERDGLLHGKSPQLSRLLPDHQITPPLFSCPPLDSILSGHFRPIRPSYSCLQAQAISAFEGGQASIPHPKGRTRNSEGPNRMIRRR